MVELTDEGKRVLEDFLAQWCWSNLYDMCKNLRECIEALGIPEAEAAALVFGSAGKALKRLQENYKPSSSSATPFQ
jgi:hypothetical protein